MQGFTFSLHLTTSSSSLEGRSSLEVRIHFTDRPASEPFLFTREHYCLDWESDQNHLGAIVFELTDNCIEWMRAKGCRFLSTSEPRPMLTITLFQYPTVEAEGQMNSLLSYSTGKVIRVEGQSMFCSVGNEAGAEGGPIVNTSNSAVIGVHLRQSIDPESGNESLVSLGSSIVAIIKQFRSVINR